MSLKSVKTLTAAQIAKKWNLSLDTVKQLIDAGAKVEKEHTGSLKDAKEIARDHLSERPDYYKKLSKVEKSKISESISTSGVRGLGNVSGDPAVINYVQQYINNNSMSYQDENGNKLKWMKKHHKGHEHNKVGFDEFNPTKLKEGISAGPEREADYSIGDSTGNTRRLPKIDEGERLKKAKRVAMAGMTAANIYTMGDVMSKASSGHGSPKGDVVRMATTLPGAAGWGATGVHYAKKAYDFVKGKKMNEEKNDLKDACWKGYTAKGLKKKGGKMVPNCVPVEEGWASIGHPYDRFGDVSRRAKFYGKKPKPTTTKNDDKDDTYKDSKQGGANVNKVKPVKSEAWMPYFTPHHKHSARLNKEKSNKPDIIVDPGGKKGQTVYENLKKETKMDTKEHINEALDNILENNLSEMKEHLLAALQEKAMEKLEEKKKDIAANYFAQ